MFCVLTTETQRTQRVLKFFETLCPPCLCGVPKNPASAGRHGFRGAPGGIRTPNLRFRRPLLYPIEVRARMVPPAGLEPATFWSATRRSIQLSHGGTKAGRQGFEPWVEVSPHSRLAGGPNRPLWHLPVSICNCQRRERDSNPRWRYATAVFKTAAFVHSAIPPARGMAPRG